MKNPAAETTGSLLFECLYLSVNPASEARLPVGGWVGNPSEKIPDIYPS